MGSWGKVGEVWLSKSVSGVWVSCSKEYNGAELDELTSILEVNNGGGLDWRELKFPTLLGNCAL